MCRKCFPIQVSMKTITCVFVLSLMSCQSHNTLRPFVPKLTVCLSPLVSYTADYYLLPVRQDSLNMLALSDNTVDIDGPDYYDNPSTTTYQNPLLPVLCSEHPDFIITGEVERISYEPAQDVENRIASYAFAGLVGLALSNENGAMAAYAQYRFFIKDVSDHILDSFVVIGVSAGRPVEVSRNQLMREANYFAATQFAGKLVLRIAKLKDIAIEHLAPKRYNFRDRIARYSTYFEAKLRSTRVSPNR